MKDGVCAVDLDHLRGAAHMCSSSLGAENREGSTT